LDKGEISQNLEYNYPRATGQYIALCDGDDYWTDPFKLKKQVEFLDENKEFLGVTNKVKVIDENNKNIDLKLHHYQLQPSNIYSLKDFENYKLPGQTSSILYRNIWKDIDDDELEMFRKCRTNGDRKLALILSLSGDIYQIPEIMSSYRKVTSTGSSWSARKKSKNLTLKKYKDSIELSIFAEKAYKKELNMKKHRLHTYYRSVAEYLKKPSKENWKVLRELSKINQDKKSEVFIHLLSKFISWPIRKVKGYKNI